MRKEEDTEVWLLEEDKEMEDNERRRYEEYEGYRKGSRDKMRI